MSNILVHREFSSAFPAKVIVEPNRIVTENWNRAQYPGKIDPKTFTPYPKNPILARFFVNIGRADALGSGVRNLYRYVKIYSADEPTLEEGDVFRITVPLRSDEQNGGMNYEGLTERQRQILAAMTANPKISINNLREMFKISKSGALREIKEIRKFIALNYDRKTNSWTF